MNTNNDNPGYPDQANMGGCIYYTWRGISFPTQTLNASRDMLLDAVRSAHVSKNVGDVVTFAEIGVYGGASLFHVFENAPNGTKCVGIDPFDTITIFNGKPETEVDSTVVANARAFLKQNYERITHAIECNSVQEFIAIKRQTAASAAATFGDHSIDVLHVDGDHSADGVYDDLSNYQSKMRPGGILIGDDADWPSVARGLARFSKDSGLAYKMISIGATHKFTIQF
jgi:hypothetical protein